MIYHGISFIQILRMMVVLIPQSHPYSVQSETFEKLLKDMAGIPQEYITTTGKVTTNAVEGFHGLALKYQGKRIHLLTIHYCCRTKMAVCVKNLGPIW